MSGIRVKLLGWEIDADRNRVKTLGEFQPPATLAATRSEAERKNPGAGFFLAVPRHWLQSPGFRELRVQLTPPAGVTVDNPERLADFRHS